VSAAERAVRRIYRILLRLYPASFRGEYDRELAAAFEDRTAGRHPFAALADAIADVVPNAIAAHVDILRADLRHARRTLARSPGYAITALAVVALGVGANTAAFSVADFVLVRPLPFPHPEQLVRLYERTPGYQNQLSPGNYKDWKDGTPSFSGMSAFIPTAVNLTGAGEPQRIGAAAVSSDFFSTIGVPALAGRAFVAADTVTAASVVISYELWQTQFGADAGVIGRRVELDGRPFTIIGIMPASFHFPSRDVQLWKTLQFTADELMPRDNTYIDVVARLAPNATVDGARRDLALTTARLERQFPRDNEKTGAAVIRLSDQLSSRNRLLLLALCGASLCILLLACANLANLLLARAASRERELAVRAALGAGRERIVRQILTESAVLTIGGGLAGVVLAVFAVPALAQLVPSSLPVGTQPTVDWRILIAALAAVVVVGIAFTLAPAARAASTRAFAALRQDRRGGGQARQRVRATLVVLEVTASVVLLITSGLLVRAVWKLDQIDPGFDAEHVATLRTALPLPRYDDPHLRASFFDAVLTRVRTLPGVESAAYISWLPFEMGGGIWPVVVNGSESIALSSNAASLRFATPQFFAALDIPIVQGRDVSASDTPGGPFAAVVSESFVRKYWPGEPPLGKHFKFANHDRTIVGVVGDIRVRGLEQTSEPQVYLPYGQQDTTIGSGYTPKELVVRTTLPLATLMPAVRRIVHDIDPLQPISDVRMMSDIVAGETASRVAQLRVLVALTLVALILSAVGIHGLLSFTVSLRAHEIGVRMALGAEASRVGRMVIREGAVLVLIALVPGIALAYAAARGMQALLAGIAPTDPVTFSVAAIVCIVTTLLGSLRPALRATRVDPMTAIRAD
jgi:putative ABC transport system permease protein